MKHTPGPWKKVKPHRIMAFDAEVNDWLTVAEIYGDTADEIDANINIFIAAPALLKALKKIHELGPICSHDCLLGDAQIIAEEAIELAEGKE